MPNNFSLFTKVQADSPFTLNNLPYGVFRRSKAESFRVGVAIGDSILDLSVLEDAGLLKTKNPIFNQDSLNPFMKLGYDQWLSVRQRILFLLNDETSELRENTALCEKAFALHSSCELKLPVNIPDYTDFFASEQHAINLGEMFRPDSNALMPNWKHMPLAYHGRSSSIIVSGTPIKRPSGQSLDKNMQAQFGKSQCLDIEAELGYLVGTGNNLGEPISTSNAHKHIFGAVLVNDWSARDIQKWEYVPLGPFLGKSFATSISPWVVSMFALEPFHVEAPQQTVPVLDYLKESDRTALDINLSLGLKSSSMPDYKNIAETNSKYLYWTYAQMLAHHTINGCNLRCGDLLASGTISGSKPHQFGSLIELAWAGEKPIQLEPNTQRVFLEDGDSVVISGTCINTHDERLGFGPVEGTIIP